MTARFSSGLAFVAMLALAPGQSRASEKSTGEPPATLRPELEQQLLSFVTAKKRQAQEILGSANRGIPFGFEWLFASMQKGDIRAASYAYKVFDALCRKKGTGNDDLSMARQVVMEAYWGWESFQTDHAGLLEQFGKDVLAVVPKGSVYFGGTDEGRFVVTALSRSHAEGSPFFTLTQNQLADLQYLKYVRRMYGDRITLPSDDDFQLLFMQYAVEALERKRQGRLKLQEDVEVNSNGVVVVTGQVAVMQLNALLAKYIFEKNPGFDFFIQESYPLDWMYPYLEPTGPILKITRNPIASMSEEVIARDHEFWSHYSKRLTGDWITYSTSAEDICDFAMRVYARKDYEGFGGDRNSLRNMQSRKALSKLRCSTGGLYRWRMNNTQEPEEHDRMAKEAAFALKQAFAFCPCSPEAVFRYTDLLASSEQLESAELVVETALRLDPKNSAIEKLLEQVQALLKKRVEPSP